MPQALQQILAIEDDPVLGSHLKTSLEARGFGVTLVDEGTRGLSLASAEDFDLILLDVLLPEMNGLELLARLRCSRSTPVLMMSALGSEADRIQGFHHGADDYLPKPFSGWAATDIWSSAMAAVAWFGMISLTGLALVLLMPYRPRLVLSIPLFGTLLTVLATVFG